MARCFLDGYWVNDQQRLPQPAAHEGLVSTCLPVLLPAAGVSIPPAVQVVSVRGMKWGANPAEGFRLPPSLSSHFSFQSLRDNIAHPNKDANGQEWEKEKLDWKK